MDRGSSSSSSREALAADAAESVAKLRAELNGMVDLLLEKKLITAEKLSAAVHADDQEGDQASDLPAG